MTDLDLRHPVMGCICAEGHIIRPDGTVTFTPPVHDCGYIKRRHAVIPAAEIEARRMVRSEHSHWRGAPEAHPDWPRWFMAEVDRAVLTAGR